MVFQEESGDGPFQAESRVWMADMRHGYLKNMSRGVVCSVSQMPKSTG